LVHNKHRGLAFISVVRNKLANQYILQTGIIILFANSTDHK